MDSQSSSTTTPARGACNSSPLGRRCMRRANRPRLRLETQGDPTMRDMPRQVAAFFLAGEDAGREAVWRPRADVYRTPDGWLVKLELAGVRPDEDVTIGA